MTMNTTAQDVELYLKEFPKLREDVHQKQDLTHLSSACAASALGALPFPDLLNSAVHTAVAKHHQPSTDSEMLIESLCRGSSFCRRTDCCSTLLRGSIWVLEVLEILSLRTAIIW